MEQAITERTKWISKITAVFAVLYAVWMILGLILTTLSRPSQSQSLPFSITKYIVLNMSLNISLICFLLWAGFRLWMYPDCKDIWLWALIPSIFIYRVFYVFFTILWGVLFQFDVILGLRTEPFLALLIAGLVYWKFKRIFSTAIKSTEPINPVILKWGGRLFFFFLSYRLFWLLDAIRTLYTPSDLDNRYYFIFIILFLLSFALAVIFYKYCVRQFIIKPLKQDF